MGIQTRSGLVAMAPKRGLRKVDSDDSEVQFVSDSTSFKPPAPQMHI